MSDLTPSTDNGNQPSAAQPYYAEVNDPDLAYQNCAVGERIKFSYSWNGEAPIIENLGGRPAIRVVPGARSFAWYNKTEPVDYAVLARFLPASRLILKPGDNFIHGIVVDKGGGLLVVQVEKVE